MGMTPRLAKQPTPLSPPYWHPPARTAKYQVISSPKEAASGSVPVKLFWEGHTFASGTSNCPFTFLDDATGQHKGCRLHKGQTRIKTKIQPPGLSLYFRDGGDQDKAASPTASTIFLEQDTHQEQHFGYETMRFLQAKNGP